jgi:hypothetical protein
MKTIFSTIFALAVCSFVLAQPPAFVNYQAVVRDAEGKILAGQEVSFKIEILKGTAAGTVVFREIHQTTTSNQGLVTLAIFGGSHDGMWEPIDWSLDDYYIKIYLDLEGGTTFQEMGTSQLLSVPYAMHAGTVSDEKQDLSVDGTRLSISDGNSVYLPETYDDFTVTKTLVLGNEGRVLSEVKEIIGTTDPDANVCYFDLPAGYTDLNTRALSVEITKEVNATFDYRYNYGLGYTATNGTIGYRISWNQIAKVGESNYSMALYYPDELKGLPFRVILLKLGVRLIPL